MHRRYFVLTVRFRTLPQNYIHVLIPHCPLALLYASNCLWRIKILAGAHHHFFIAHSAHEFLPTLGYFVGLRSYPFNLYRIISFEKFHVVDLGIKRQFSDLTHHVIRRSAPLPLSRSVNVINGRLMGLPPSAKVEFYRPFRSTTDDTQAGISRRIRRESVPIL